MRLDARQPARLDDQTIFTVLVDLNRMNFFRGHSKRQVRVRHCGTDIFEVLASNFTSSQRCWFWHLRVNLLLGAYLCMLLVNGNLYTASSRRH